MNTVSPRPPSAKQAGGGAVSSSDLDPIRALLAGANRALDGLHQALDDMLGPEPLLSPKARALAFIDRGDDAALKVREAQDLVDRLPLGALGSVRRTLASVDEALTDLRRELLSPAAALPRDLRRLEIELRQHLDAATTELDQLDDADAEWNPGAPRRASPASLPPPPDEERVDPRAPSARCTVVPALPSGCPLLPWKEAGRVG
jgi:hypothetical protein